MNDHAWNELLEEFRKLGGTADNIRVRIGPLGRGLFPIDTAKPVSIRVPESLLIASKDVIFRNGAPQASPDAKIGERERAFLDEYLEKFSWGDGGRAEVENMFAMAQALSPDLLHRMLMEFRCGPWFQEGISDETIQADFLRARGITYGGNVVIPPIIEFVNHGAAPGFGSSNGLSIEGTFSGEVLVEYSDMDPFGIFQSWGFAFASPVALSVALKGNIQSHPLSIGRQRFSDTEGQSIWVPKLRRDGGQVMLPFLMLGHLRYPKLAKGIFYKVLREAGYSGVEECFDQIQHANRMRFLDLVEALEGVNLPIAHTLRMMALYQLRAMSFSCGVP